MGETKTGAFLRSVKDSFEPEVFFDVICFVELHISLSVAAKSRVMLREAGLDEPLTDEQKEQYLSEYKEYTELEKRLGKGVRMTIGPIVKFYPADRKALEDLLGECRTRRHKILAARRRISSSALILSMIAHTTWKVRLSRV